jgi:hypothetical protein
MSDEKICGLCFEKKFLLKLSSCSSHHNLHMHCLEKAFNQKIIFQWISCSRCVEELVSNFSPKSSCVKCSSLLPTPASPCLLRKHLCVACAQPYLDEPHFKSCGQCRADYAFHQFCSACSHIFTTNSLLFSSDCEHKYCKTCVFSTELPHLCCLDFVRSQIPECSLCEAEVALNSIRCSMNHFYCEKCVEYFLYYKQECRGCFELFNQFAEAKVRNDKEGVENVTIKPEKTGILKCFSCQINKPIIYHPPSCMEHFFCLTCVNSKKTKVDCLNCSRYFQMISVKIDENQIACALCGSFPDGTNVFCESNHSYCLSCLRTLNSMPKICYLNFIRCVSCIKEMVTIRKYRHFHKEIQNFSIETIPITYLSCGHSIRDDKLMQLYLKSISRFNSRFRNSRVNRIKKRFGLKCTTANCGKKFIVPMTSFKKQIKHSFDAESVKIFKEFELYFDGARCEFYICGCNRIVGKIGGLILNCECKS